MQEKTKEAIINIDKSQDDRQSQNLNDDKNDQTNQLNQNEQTAQQSQIYRSFLPPANPIIDTDKEPDQQINMKLLDSSGKNLRKGIRNYANPMKKLKKDQQVQDRPIEKMTLFNGYDTENLLYRRFNNEECNQLNKKKYFSSLFSPIYLRQNMKFQMKLKIPQFQGMKKPQNINDSERSLIDNLQNQLEFDSNFESGNLFAVFKTGTYTYDLILQNDMNTTGCTQWFYFSVKNHKNKNITATFNIINLYKSSSLYNQGMKPLVFSQKSGKGWMRKGENIFYEKNSIHRQGSKKYYSSLSFTYDFIKENDIVYFAHSLPYTYQRLQELLKKVQLSKKVIDFQCKCRIKSIGVTPLKKNIPIIKFESQDPKVEKKAIILMARQHPGEVQGSFLMQQILLNFLKPQNQIEFLLWRFNFYIIPMVNIDGVCLGNYRCNAMGYDLNRNWQGQQKSKHPEIFYIKNEIKKIMSKHPIQLIIDFHGHSNKMNSFFYGNPFGPNPFVFPYAAAKNTPFISFEDCTFNIQRKQKAKTARSVLGNLIKDTGNVYTYQISFYGGLKNGKVINFNEQKFGQLGKVIISTIYKIYVESYKEQKVLKESSYLKSLRKQISNFQANLSYFESKGSDTEAQQDRDEEEEQKNQDIKQKLKEIFQSDLKGNFQFDLEKLKSLQNQKINISSRSLNKKSLSQQKKKLSDIYSRFNENLGMNKSVKPYNIDSFATINKKNQQLQQKSRKQKLFADKLKIFGQNYLPQSYTKVQSQIDQKGSLKFQSVFQEKKQESLRIDFVIKTRRMRNREQNFSTLSPTKSQWKDEEASMQDIVKVNRLEYKKIQRAKDRAKDFKKSIEKKTQNLGVFRLPSIINNFKL